VPRPTFDEEQTAAYPPFQMGQSHWLNDVVATLAFSAS
jgi:hypothetical protein